MIKKLYVAILFLLLGVNVRTQTTLATEKPNDTLPIRICVPSRASLLENQPLYVIDGIIIRNRQALTKLNPKEIESITVLKDLASKGLYVNNGENGVVVVQLKKNVKYLSLNKILQSIKSKDRHLPIYLGNEKLLDREGFYLSKDQIKDISIVERFESDTDQNKIIQISLKP